MRRSCAASRCSSRSRGRGERASAAWWAEHSRDANALPAEAAGNAAREGAVWARPHPARCFRMLCLAATRPADPQQGRGASARRASGQPTSAVWHAKGAWLSMDAMPAHGATRRRKAGQASRLFFFGVPTAPASCQAAGATEPGLGPTSLSHEQRCQGPCCTHGGSTRVAAEVDPGWGPWAATPGPLVREERSALLPAACV